MPDLHDIIDVRGVVKRFGTIRVLDGVALRVARGEVAAIVGPSGGGKSTLLRCINGLEEFQEGEIRVAGVVLPAESGSRRERAVDDADLRKLRRQVGMVFQQFHLFPHMTALGNVCAGPRFALGQDREQCEAEGLQLLERVGLKTRHAHKPHQLSGGQQQRVAIARALAMKPQAILFDEPTSALDPRNAADVIAVIVDLAKSGQTMIVVTHAVGLVRSAAGVVHVMHEGRIVESGPPGRVFDEPQEHATRAFLAETGGR